MQAVFDGLRAARGERAIFRGVSAWGIEGVSDDVASLDEGFHVVVMTFEGKLTAVRMTHVTRHESQPWAGAQVVASMRETGARRPWPSWRSSLEFGDYVAGVHRIHDHIAAGSVYQVNLCRVLSRETADEDLDALFANLLEHNPAPFLCRIDIAGMLDIVSASPEMFLQRSGEQIVSSPIKGTAETGAPMLDKDVTENVMITDLVRNDLQRVCRPGTVEVDGFLERVGHPGLDHLVSTVRGRLRRDVAWPEILAATFPPGSVSGAPKASALRVIAELEGGKRGPYCGAIGWIDAEAERAELAVGIRTFWRDMPPAGDGRNEFARSPIVSGCLHFGAGAGITWDSVATVEWEETQLKARRLLAVADGAVFREK